MTLVLSYEARQRCSDPAMLRETEVQTQQAFELIPYLGLRTPHSFISQRHEIEHLAGQLLALLERTPPVIDVHARDAETGETLLHLYAKQLFPPAAVLHALVAAGADLNAQRPDTGTTPLHAACQTLAHSLNDLARDGSAIQGYYETQMRRCEGLREPLQNHLWHYGIKRLHSTAELLLGYGANATVADRQGHLPRDVMMEPGQPSVWQFEKAGRDAYALLAADQFHGATPHLLLQCANAGLLGHALSHPDWPHGFGETMLLLEPLAQSVQRSVRSELLALVGRDDPQPTVSQWELPEKLQPHLPPPSREAS